MKMRNHTLLLTLAGGLFLNGFHAFAETTNYVSAFDISLIQQGWGEPQANKSVGGNPISIGHKQFEKGLGTHAESVCILFLNGKGITFKANVGVDDEVGTNGSVVFKVLGDGKQLYVSKTLHGGDEAETVEVPVNGVKELTLQVDAGEGIDFGHADWANARVIEIGNARPRIVSSFKETAPILTPATSPKPAIHSAKVFGVRPGNPFLYTIAATGDRPMTFYADFLPEGLKLDAQTGQITGSLKDAGQHTVQLRARNSLGEAMRTLKIVCGSKIGLTPALGWNSWNCFASAVTAEKVKSAADAMVSSGLINHGWTYINVDDFWETHQNSTDPTLQGEHRDANGKINPNTRFPDMKGLADYIHSKGLKAGLYSSPGPWTCGGCTASYKHELDDAESCAQWGFDYLKYDWCSYGDIANGGDPSAKDIPLMVKDGNNLAAYQHPYRVMRAALDKQQRDILFSFCQYGDADVWNWGEEVGGNSWRTTGDITDNWRSMSGIGFNQNGHEKFSGPGHFNDPDMLVVGKVGWGPSLHPTHLTRNEQYTHISLWCLLASPLLIGCDMTQLDDFTLSLLTNDEVLEVNQDPLGHGAARVSLSGNLEVWAKDMEDGSKAVGLFNRGYAETTVTAKWADLGITGKQKVRDLWRQKNIGAFSKEFTAKVPRHGVVLVRIIPAK